MTQDVAVALDGLICAILNPRYNDEIVASEG
jgi:hypothetical protein